MDGLVNELRERLSYKQILAGVVIGAVVSLVVKNGQININEDMIPIDTKVNLIDSNPSIQVELAGAVMSPGVYKLPDNTRVGELIALGKGISNDVSLTWVTKNLNSAQILSDSQKLYIPFAWEISEDEKFPLSKLEDIPKSDSAPTNSEKNEQNNDISKKINVNLAPREELKSLPGIGEVFSEKIVLGRPYTDISDFESRSGISKATLEKIKDLISL